MTIRIGTRGSALATWQAEWVANELRGLGVDVQIVILKTEGDVNPQSLGVIGGQGVFTKAIQRALLADEVDLAVHSLKDLPTLPVEGLELVATPPRESCGDVLVSNRYRSLAMLPERARVGTGSARRAAQLRHHRGDLLVQDIRGNVGTRLEKLDADQYDALILAEAGVRRLGLEARIAEVLSREWMLPAVGQGALGLEIRGEDEATRAFVEQLNDRETMASVIAERTMLRTLEAGCLAPVGAWARADGEQLILEGVVLDPEGRQRLHARCEGSTLAADALGQEAAKQLLEQGAAALIGR